MRLGKGKAKLDQLHSCLNCGAQVRGNFCPICGQRNDDFKRPITSLAKDLAEDAFSLDSRFYRTLATLLMTPGRLTRDFADGKRARYTPPIRLYLLSTILLFVMLSFSNVALVSLDMEPTPSETSGVKMDIEGAQAEFKSISFFKLVSEPVKGAVLLKEEQIEEAVQDTQEDEVAANFARDVMQGLNAMAEDPRVANKAINAWLPRVMILLLPLFALTLKLFYIFRKQFLFNHAIYSLHFHSALFLVLAFFVGAQWAAMGHLPGNLLAQIFLGFTAIYSLLGLKGFYRQGWIKTVIKWLMLGGAYILLLMLSLGLAIWLNLEFLA